MCYRLKKDKSLQLLDAPTAYMLGPPKLRFKLRCCAARCEGREDIKLLCHTHSAKHCTGTQHTQHTRKMTCRWISPCSPPTSKPSTKSLPMSHPNPAPITFYDRISPLEVRHEYLHKLAKLSPEESSELMLAGHRYPRNAIRTISTPLGIS